MFFGSFEAGLENLVQRLVRLGKILVFTALNSSSIWYALVGFLVF